MQLEIMVHRLQNEIKKLTVELLKARDQQEDHLRHLRALERALGKMERQREQQQAAQVGSALPPLPVPVRAAPPWLRPRRCSRAYFRTEAPAAGSAARGLGARVARLVLGGPGRQGSLGHLKGLGFFLLNLLG